MGDKNGDHTIEDHRQDDIKTINGHSTRGVESGTVGCSEEGLTL